MFSCGLFDDTCALSQGQSDPIKSAGKNIRGLKHAFQYSCTSYHSGQVLVLHQVATGTCFCISFFFLYYTVIHLKCVSLLGTRSNPTPAMSPAPPCLCIWLPCLHLLSPHHNNGVYLELEAKKTFALLKRKALPERRSETVWEGLLCLKSVAFFKRTMGVTAL